LRHAIVQIHKLVGENVQLFGFHDFALNARKANDDYTARTILSPCDCANFSPLFAS
jgi:hypothetical protein